MADPNPLFVLSQIALVAGVDSGFNAAGVERWVDRETLEPRIAITFGEQEALRKRRPATLEWALSYASDAQCIRKERTVDIPAAALFESAAEVRARLIPQLLELMD